ncbi:hypothetical protein, partial [Pseudomonas sp.]|uniref:hypothetical protein n=1 Tax=Pseudomonas sp. TaxID=306 RepID=UPI003FD7029E
MRDARSDRAAVILIGKGIADMLTAYPSVSHGLSIMIAAQPVALPIAPGSARVPATSAAAATAVTASA